MAEYNVQLPDGSEYHIQADSDEQANAAVNDLTGTSKIGQLESFGRGAANNVPLVPQAIAGLSEGDYSKNLEDWNQKAAEAKSANPVTYGAGAVTGAVAPMLIPGVGGALKAFPILGNALYGAASAVSNTDLSKNPEEAAKEAIKGAGIGAVMGKAGDMIMPSASKLEQIGQEQGIKSIGLRPGSLVDDAHFDDMGKFIHQHDLTSGHLPERLAKVQELKQQYGDAIENAGIGATPLKDATPFTDPLHAKAHELNALTDPQSKAEANTFIHGITNIQQNGKTFSDLQKLKSIYGDRAFDKDHNVVDKASFAIWKQVSDAMKSIIKDSPEEYQAAMKGYSHSMDIEAGLAKQLGLERSVSQGSSGVGGHGLHSLLRQVPAFHNPSVGIPTGIGLAAMGHPVLGAALGAHSLMSNPQAKSATAYGLSKVAGSAQNLVSMGGTAGMVHHFINNQAAYGKFAPALNQAIQQGGTNGFNATSYVMRMQHPELNDIMMKRDEDNANQ